MVSWQLSTDMFCLEAVHAEARKCVLDSASWRKGLSGAVTTYPAVDKSISLVAKKETVCIYLNFEFHPLSTWSQVWQITSFAKTCHSVGH